MRQAIPYKVDPLPVYTVKRNTTLRQIEQALPPATYCKTCTSVGLISLAFTVGAVGALMPQQKATAALPLMRLEMLGAVSPSIRLVSPLAAKAPVTSVDVLSTSNSTVAQPDQLTALTPSAPLVVPTSSPEATATSLSVSSASVAEAEPKPVASSAPLVVPSESNSPEFSGAASIEPEMSAKLSESNSNAGEAAVTDAELAKTVIPNPQQSALVDADALTYQVKPGDTIEKIAKEYQISEQELTKSNRLNDPNVIQVNEVLKIPSARSSLSYSVLSLEGSTPEVARKITPATLMTASTAQVALASPLVAQGQDTSTIESSVNKLGSNDLSSTGTQQAEQIDKSALALSPQIINQALPTGINKADPVQPLPRHSQLDLRQEKPWVDKPKVQTVAQAAVATLLDEQEPAAQISPAPSFYVPIAKRTIFPQIPRLDLPPLASVDNYLPKDVDNHLNGSFSGSTRFIWPAKGVFTSGYGFRWGRMHRGIDIAAPVGTPIVASAPGVVVTAGWNSGGYGNLIELRHPNGSLTVYAHNNRLIARVGQQVYQGEKIAEMGSTGRSTGPHSHFEIHPAGKGAVNPMFFLSRG